MARYRLSLTPEHFVHRRCVGTGHPFAQLLEEIRDDYGRNVVLTIENFVSDYDLKGGMVTGVMDSEPSMANGGSILTEN